MRFGALIVAAAAIACAAPAYAEGCGPLKRISSIDLMPLGGGRMAVPVTINGEPKKLLLSTAGDFTTLNAALVKELNLEALTTRRVKLIDSAGNASQMYVHAKSFQIGTLEGKDFPFLITPDPIVGESAAFDGAMAADLMAHYDVELDFAAGKMNFFSQDHCPGRVVYWPASAVAIVPFQERAPIPGGLGNQPGRFSTHDDFHIRVPVTVDGKSFLATINTASPRSTMTAAAAKYKFGITADSPDSVPLGLVDRDPRQKTFGRTFSSLTLDGVTVTNPHFAILPDLAGSKDPYNSLQPGSRTQHVDEGLFSDITIGMDVLRRLHIYVAFDERKLYITPASGHVVSGPAAGDASLASATTDPGR
jgi:hypothetical protein